MGVEINIVFGLGVLTVLFAYFSFEYREAEDFTTNFLSKLFFGLSMVFIIIIINVLYMIADQNGLTYLRDGPLTIVIEIIYYLMVIVVAIYFVMMLVMILQFLYDLAQVKWGSTKKTRSNKEGRE